MDEVVPQMSRYFDRLRVEAPANFPVGNGALIVFDRIHGLKQVVDEVLVHVSIRMVERCPVPAPREPDDTEKTGA